MKQIIVLGSGCTKCTKTVEFIQSVAAECGIPVDVIKETNPEVIMNFGIMTTPAVVVDNVVMHSGSIPDRKKIESWLK